MKKSFFITIFVCSLFVLPFAFAANHHDSTPKVEPAAALQKLQEGNSRFVVGNTQHPNANTDCAKETAEHGQHPFATILCCSDSRVPLSVVFDQGIGDIFSVCAAGNVTGPAQNGSIEYGVAHTGTRLVVVLGHTKCGAVTAACTNGGHECNIETLMRAIAPAVKRTEASTGKTGAEIIEPCCKENVYLQIEQLYRCSEILREAARSGELQIVGAIYDVSTGKVDFIGAHPKNDELVKGKQATGVQVKRGLFGRR
ncbi:MAG: carbonic anhydrase [Planctomycetaceae bacterium]|nr:carbonic anhydrase [Planctomycetaceae bacterium]